ncbi:hypothetical protein J4426_03220 [Candidatus Woesearchaeota archaeon]|nr:hypothetical protein [Candidatus Woesearchaeota archaeon]
MDNQASANITTAVDSLVSLVNSKKRISMEEAAQILGLPESILNEWASFLGEEKILGIEYQLTTPFLVAKNVEEEATKEERTSSDEIEKDLLVRKIQFMMAALNKYNPRSALKIRNEDDLKRAIKSESLSKEDRLYLQKAYLQLRLAQLIVRLKEKGGQDIFKINQDIMILEKRKKLFENNF